MSAFSPWLDANGDSLYFSGCAPTTQATDASDVMCAGYRMLLSKRQVELWVKGGSSLSTSDP
jgi:hypothetical protein